MFSKKMILLVICIVGILSISAVTAADNISDDVNMDAADDDAVSFAETELIADDEPVIYPNGTFDDLQDKINDHSEIDLDRNYTYNGSSISGIVINKDMEIDGHSYTIDAQGQSGIFIIESGNVVLKNINFLNGNFSNGGAINGSCTLENCNFINNTASGNGGAVCGNCTITNSQFMYNTASGNGGAVCGNCTIINCHFMYNSASGDGGAVYGNCTVSDCQFMYNTASGDGGAVYGGYAEESSFRFNNADCGGAAYAITVKFCNFTDNIASNDGGAVFEGNVENSAFYSNQADRNGGAMYGGTATWCNFTSNIAGKYGGATYETIVVNCSEKNNKNGTTSRNSTFSSLQKLINDAEEGSTLVLDCNYVCEEGYDIYGVKIKKSIVIDGNGFTVDGQGRSRLFSVYAKNVEFINLYLINGYLDVTTDTYGGAISGDKVSTARNCTFINNKACYGGVSDKLNPINCTFINNSANLYGGALYSCDAQDCIFYSNTVEFTGGAMWGTKSNPVTATRCTFIQCYAKSSGGALYRGNANQCIFISNNAGENGGAVYADDNSDYGVVFNSTFINNTVGSGSGQAMFNGHSLLCIFENNNYMGTEIRIPTIEVDEEISTFPGDILPLKLTWNGTEYDGFNVIVKVYKDFINVGNYSVLSGGDWVMNLTPGEYNVILHLEKYSEMEKIEFNLKLTSENNIIVAPDVVIVYNYVDDYLITLKTDYGLPITNANLTVELNGEKKNYTTDDDGNLRFNIQGFAPGEYYLNITYEGSSVYNGTNATAKIVITKAYSRFNLYDVITFYNMDDELVIVLTDGYGIPINGTSVYVDFNGTGNYTTDENGQINISTKGLMPDTYYANFTFKGNDFYHGSSGSSKITVNKCITRIFTNDIKTSYNVNEDLVIVLNDNNGNFINGAVVYVDLNGLKNYTTDSKGRFNISTKGLTPNSYIAFISFKGNGTHQSSNATANITIYKSATEINANAVETGYGDSTEWVITLTDDLGNPVSNALVSFTFDSVTNHTTDSAGQIVFSTNLASGWVISITDDHGNPINSVLMSVNLTTPVNYTTDENGQIKLSVKKLNSDSYIANITFKGNELYMNSTTTTSVVINKESTKLTANAVTATYGTANYLVISLTDSHGNSIKNTAVNVNLGGVKTYTTDENGQIKIKTQSLTPKSYTVKITFNGNNNYASSNANTVVIVKKATPKLKVKSKKFTALTKTKKFVIVLKSNVNKAMKNKKVYLKVNGKTYAAKTNSKGKATFKIKKLTKKGKYSAVVKYKGNTYYNKVTKKVKIKIA